MDFGLDFIMKLKPCSWRYKGPLDDGLTHFGFVAQDVLDVASMDEYNFVVIGPDGVHYHMNNLEFIGPSVKAIQDLKNEVDELKKQIAHLK